MGDSRLKRWLGGLAVAAVIAAGAKMGESARYYAAPEFPSQNQKDWIGTPQSLKALSGKVVLIDVWTFLCINCQRTIPWIQEMDKRFAARGLVTVGVHTPEFEKERSRGNVETAVKELGLSNYSHFLDNHMSYWRALRNEYWPAVYIVDKHGQIRTGMFGEIHIGTGRDKETVQLVEKLLGEETAPSH